MPRQRRRHRQSAANVESARLVVTVQVNKEGVPVVTAEQCPAAYRLDRHTVPVKFQCRMPGIFEPAYLNVLGCMKMHFGQCQRYAVAFPGILQQPAHAARSDARSQVQVYVSVSIGTVTAMAPRGEFTELTGQVAFARRIMVAALQVRRRNVGDEPVELLLAETSSEERFMERMARTDASAKQIEAQPAPFVLVIRLVAECGGTVRVAQVLAMDQPGRRIDHADNC